MKYAYLIERVSIMIVEDDDFFAGWLMQRGLEGWKLVSMEQMGGFERTYRLIFVKEV